MNREMEKWFILEEFNDEYRPIVRSDKWKFDNNMMIFSSNRPGGKGGFDLYFVGIERKGEI